MVKVFLSYAQQDKALARSVAQALSDLQTEVWLDEANLRFGDNISATISQAIADSDLAVLLVTPAYLASRYISMEQSQAMASALRVVPIIAGGLDSSALPSEIRHIESIRLPASSTSPRQLREELSRLIGPRFTEPSLPIRSRSNARRLDYLQNPLEINKSLEGTVREIDLATTSIDGIFGLVVDRLERQMSRGVRVRAVLADPDYYGDPLGGRNIELSAKSRIGIERISHIGNLNLSIRLVAEPITQSVLRIDDVWYVDPFPMSPMRRGYLKLSRGLATSELFSQISTAFEALYIGGRSLIPQEDAPTRLELERLRTSGNAGLQVDAQLERAVYLYFQSRGYEAAPHVAVGNTEVDLLLWEPSGGPPAIVEIKQSEQRVPATVVDQLRHSAQQIGARRAYLVTNRSVGQGARRRIEQLRDEIDIQLLTSDEIYASLVSATE